MRAEPTIALGPLPCRTCGMAVTWLRTVLGEVTLVDARPDDDGQVQPHECPGVGE